ncbi:IS1 family transposase [Methanobrevibacter cuticularis]|uniref:IS1 family transposase n=1 Tax=Methanobrevibacter cuticularis TaxID=47311 RepID=UPI0009FBE60F
MIFGKIEEIDNSNISTTLIERQNLNLIQDNKRLTRKTISYSKKDKWLQKNFNLYKSSYNFIKTHHSLKKKNLKKIRNNAWKNMIK